MPPSHSTSVPSCSTESLLNPSIPTQNAASDVSDPHVAAGSVQVALTLLKSLPVSA